MSELFRVARTMPAMLAHVFADPDGEQAATVTDVKVTAVSAAGNAIVLPAPAGPNADGEYTSMFGGSPALDLITVTWSATLASTSITITDEQPVEVCGGHYFELGAVRKADAELADPRKFSTAALRAARVEVEQEFEAITARSFVPRYRRVVLDGTDDAGLILPDPDVRRILAVTVVHQPGGDPVPLTTAELAALITRPRDRTLSRPRGLVWAQGDANVVVQYEHGLDAPPVDVRRAALVRMRSRLMLNRSGIPSNADSWTDSSGTTFRLTMPGAYATGVPEVDAVLDRYSLRPPTSSGSGSGGTSGGSRTAPASRTIDYDPQKFSIFHRGI